MNAHEARARAEQVAKLVNLVRDEASGARTVRAAYEPIGDEGLGAVRAERKAAAL